MDYNIINTEYLYEISTDPIFIKKMIGLFRQNIAQFSNEMPDAILKKDFIKLAELAHKAKSSIMIFGMKDDAEKMKTLEFDAKNNKNIDTFNERINNFFNNCEHALQEIDILENNLK